MMREKPSLSKSDARLRLGGGRLLGGTLCNRPVMRCALGVWRAECVLRRVGVGWIPGCMLPDNEGPVAEGAGQCHRMKARG